MPALPTSQGSWEHQELMDSEHFQKHSASSRVVITSSFADAYKQSSAVLVGKLNPSLINQPVYCRLVVARLALTLPLGLPLPLFAALPVKLQRPEPGMGPGKDPPLLWRWPA